MESIEGSRKLQNIDKNKESSQMEGGEKNIIKIDTEDVKLETDDIINLINSAEKENTITLLTDIQSDEPEENESEEDNEFEEYLMRPD